MDESERIKRKIKAKLNALRGYRLYCGICGKYACTATQPRQIVHYDCWKASQVRQLVSVHYERR